MSTHAKVTIYDENNNTILSFLSHWDGYFNGLGVELQKQLKNKLVLPGGCCMDDPRNISLGMYDLAAQVLCQCKIEAGLKMRSKNNVGGIYISDPNMPDMEFNYEIRHLSNGHVSLVGSNGEDTIDFPLYDILYTQIAEFVYDKDGDIEWRKLGLLEMHTDYLLGYDLNDDNKIKRFNFDRIVGGEEKIRITSVE